MSVIYSTRIGYGYIIPFEEYKKLSNMEDFCENDFAIPIDSWDPEFTDYFFGILTNYIKHGTGINFADVGVPSSKMIQEMRNTFIKFFPNRELEIPKYQILSCVD